MNASLNVIPRSTAAAVLALAATVAASADTVELAAARDNTIFGGPSSNSNGAGSSMFAGRNSQGDLRRLLIQFDVAAGVPAGATITSATLTLHMSMTSSGPQPVTLHRVLADWGEAGSNSDGGGGGGGSGAPAQIGDATWLKRFYDTVPWTSAGGDFLAGASATQTVGSKAEVGFYDWGTTELMVADVQGWLDDPDANFGWIMRGNESVVPSTKRFDTREHEQVQFRPRLTIEFEPPSLPGDVTGDGLVNLMDLVEVIADWGPCPPPPEPCDADLDGSMEVDVVDLVEVVVNWT